MPSVSRYRPWLPVPAYDIEVRQKAPLPLHRPQPVT